MNRFVHYSALLPSRHYLVGCGDRLVCVRCSGSNETLTTECNGGMLTLHEKDLIAEEKLDYKQGEWVHLEDGKHD